MKKSKLELFLEDEIKYYLENIMEVETSSELVEKIKDKIIVSVYQNVWELVGKTYSEIKEVIQDED